jgi:hypothetical protein
VLRAGQTTAVGVMLVVPWNRTVASIRATAWRDEPGSPDDSPDSRFEVLSSKYEPGLDPGSGLPRGVAAVTGSLTSHLKRNTVRALVTAVCVDARDAIIGGGDVQTDRVPPGATVPFEIPEVTSTGRPASCRSYAVASRHFEADDPLP